MCTGTKNNWRGQRYTPTPMRIRKASWLDFIGLVCPSPRAEPNVTTNGLRRGLDLSIGLKRSTDLANDAIGDIHPPRRRVEECLHGGDLGNDQDRKRVEVNPVDAAIDDEVADDAETNQRVYAGRREDERQVGEAAEGCVGQGAGGDQHQAPMELGLRAPVDSEGKGHGEGGKGREPGQW
jgi:hypothetical protein